MELKQATSDKTSDKSKRLIFADDALRILKNCRNDNPYFHTRTHSIWETAVDCAMSCVDAMPTVDAVVLPCKVGDTVFRIARGNYHTNYKPFVQPMTVTEISWKLEKHGTKDLGFAIIADGIRYRFSSVGKSVFLAREEAERIINQEVPNG